LIFDARVLANDPVGGDNWILRLSTNRDISDFRAGAFYHLKVDPGPFPLFRRAYSVLSATRDSADVLYKVTGTGTRLLSRRRAGETISAVGPLGNTFTSPGAGETAILVAGGVGVPPILRWAENLMADGVPKSRIAFLFGARTADELVLRDRLARLGIPIRFATDDGTEGYHGRVTDLLRGEWETLKARGARARYYACGPSPMLKACTELSLKFDLHGELALETPMPCGSGVCLGCIIPTRGSQDDAPTYRRTCIDGPIFDAREVLWP
jgi:dihydroorotate dehydrogenase electron transfer subunit